MIEELVLATPLVMHPGVAVQVQVVVGAPGDSGAGRCRCIPGLTSPTGAGC